METNKTYGMVDVFRILCCLMVIAIHTSAFTYFSETTHFMIAQTLFRIAVPFFLITSGYFMYAQLMEPGYVKKFILRLGSYYLIVNTISYFMNYALYHEYYASIGMNYFSLIHIFQSYVINGFPDLWYFPALFMSTLLLYQLQKRHLQKLIPWLCVGFAVIAISGDSWYGIFNPTPFHYISDAYTSIFTITRNGFAIAMPFLYIGMLCAKQDWAKKVHKPWLLAILAMILLYIEAIILRYMNASIDFNIYISLFIVTPLLFIGCLQTRVIIKYQTSKFIRNLTLWVYFIHQWVILMVAGSITIVNWFMASIVSFAIVGCILYCHEANKKARVLIK